ncbi:MAG: TatD family nuclease-associated radical SAM protein [Candidatus Bathyarchaeia archaeon]|nr:TatD family nuclease-associated radical SAM protein [Candidatus Bathyarchaeota archaeon]
MLKKNGDIVYWLEDSLYLNITNRCSNKCYFCFRHFWDGIAGFRLKLGKEPSTEQVIKELKKHISRRRWEEVVFCGFGEPTIRLDCVLEVARWIKKYYPFLKIRLNTNGHAVLLNPNRDVARELKGVGIDIVSVSLNGHDEETYNKVCRPEFREAYKNVINFILALKDTGIDTEITAVELPEIDIQKIQDFAKKINVKFRLRQFIPLIY